jgi:SAM-dependent methyltransferase
MTSSYLESVKQQYEVLPYPVRDPADEARRLVQTIGDNLLVANHFCFRGRRDFRSGFRCFVAGGGTGDATIYLAEQLRFFDAEVVYLDLSEASRAIAEERARRRGLTNIRWITGSIMDIPKLGLGEFDYINCSGVLHHLESAERGLALLTSVLEDDGAMFIMLYGKYARREVYDMQELLRAYLPTGIGIAQKIAMARRLIDALPPTNSFRRNIAMWQWEFAPDGFGDAGFYDLLLHSQDRCFDVPEIYALAAAAGLHIAGFPMRGDRYDPCRLVADPEIRRYLAGLPLPRQRSLAEKMSCALRTHEFYLTRRSDTVASLDDEDSALLLFWGLRGRHRWLAEQLHPGQPFTYQDGDQSLAITGNPINKVLFAGMDGNTPIGRLYEQVVATVPGASREAARAELRGLFDFLNPAGYLYILACGSHANQLPDYRRNEYL